MNKDFHVIKIDDWFILYSFPHKVMFLTLFVWLQDIRSTDPTLIIMLLRESYTIHKLKRPYFNMIGQKQQLKIYDLNNRHCF